MFRWRMCRRFSGRVDVGVRFIEPDDGYIRVLRNGTFVIRAVS